MRPIERPWLIQRLQKPWKIAEDANPLFKAMVAGAAGPFSFGGGYVNGGLSKEANKILGEIFQFDYMGSAEFEFGEVPKALGRIAKDVKDFTAFEWKPPKGVRYDAAWHDVWDDICTDNLVGMRKLHRKYGKRCGWQGSWCRGECERSARQERHSIW
jgi:hypothetical protein